MDFTVKTPADHQMRIYAHGKSEGASTQRIEPPAKSGQIRGETLLAAPYSPRNKSVASFFLRAGSNHQHPHMHSTIISSYGSLFILS